MKNEQLVLKLILEGKTKSLIVRETGVAFSTLKKWMNKNNLVTNSGVKIITQNIINQIIAEYQNGLTNKQISNKLHIAPQTVRKYLGNVDYNTERKKPLDKNLNLVLSKEQEEVLYGSLLGDMSIGILWKEARFSITQGGDQEKYFDHKCSIFNNLLGKISKRKRYDKRTDKYYNRYAVRSLCHPCFTKLYKELYINGVKTITKEYLDKITPRGLAFWFMDDGNNTGTIATNCFSYEECILIQNFLKQKFDIETSLHHLKNKGGVQYIIYIKALSRNKFYNLVKDYIIPEMQYKFQGWE